MINLNGDDVDRIIKDELASKKVSGNIIQSAYNTLYLVVKIVHYINGFIYINTPRYVIV